MKIFENAKKTAFKAKTAMNLATAVCGSTALATSTMALGATNGATGFGEDVNIVSDGNMDAGKMMGKVIGILLTITRFVGVALIIYGIYEVVMSFMQNQPEAKTKGIIMALSGVVMTTLKTILKSLGVIG